MASCEHCRDNLLESLYGLLDGEEARELEEHLSGCAPCRAALEQARRDQTLLGRAAHVVREVAPFSIPGSQPSEEFSVPGPFSAPETPLPATLPMTPAPRRRSALRRYWPAWTAAAAMLAALIGGQHFYQQGHQDRAGAVGQARKDLDTLDARFASLEKTFAGNTLKLEADLRDERIHVHAMGPTQYHPALPAVCRVTARDAEGKPAGAEVSLKILDVADTVRFETKVKGEGEIALTIPPGLDLDPSREPERQKDGAKPSEQLKLILETTSGKSTERMEETLTPAPITHTTHISLNKNTFNLGEVMFFRTVTLDRVSHQPPKESIPLRFSLLNGEGKEVFGLVGQTGPGGIAAGNFALTEELANGVYTLLARPEENAKDRVLPQTQVVEVFRDEGLEFELDRAQYKAGELVKAWARPKTSAKLNRKVEEKRVADQKNDQYGLRITVDGKPVPALNAGAYSPELQQRLTPDAQGNAFLEFKLPAKFERGDVVLELERKAGKSTERFVHAVSVAPAEVTVDFFPEGGELVPGVTNTVYYRVRSATGEPIDPEKLTVSSGDTTIHQSKAGAGLGYFSFVPRGKDTYKAQVTLPGPVGDKMDIPDPFRNLNLVTEGVVLHIPRPVAKAGEPVDFVLRNPGPSRRLLLVSSCRGVVFDQRVLSITKGDNEGQVPLPAGIDGLLRFTLLHLPGDEQDGFKTARPLAERLVFRAPAGVLAVTCDVEKGPYRPGQKLKVNIEVRDEKKQETSAWMLASVVDERVRSPYSEVNLPAFFHIASNLSSGEDLDLAFIHLNGDTKEAAAALDLFLGVHGWRRFVSEPGTDALAKVGETSKKTTGKGGASFILPIFSKENRPLLELQTSYQTARVQALAEWEKRAGQERGELVEERERALVTASVALEGLAEYEIAPKLYFRAGLGVLLFLFMAGGVLGLVVGLYRYARAQPLRPAVGLSFVCLALALGLLTAGRQLLPREITSDIDPGRTAWLKRTPWREGRIAWKKDELRFNKLAEPPLVGPFALKAEESLAPDAFGDRDNVRRASPVFMARTTQGDGAESGKDGNRLRDQFKEKESGASAPQLWTGGVPRYFSVPLEPLFQNEEMQSRFEVASKAQRSPYDKHDQEKTGTEKGERATGGPTNLLPMPPLSYAREASEGAAKSKRTKSEGKKSDRDDANGTESLGLLVREYTYRAFPLRPYYQHTVSWHPTLHVENGSAEITFDLSPDVSAYRILLLANDPTGRLGAYEGRLDVAPSGEKK